MRSGCNASYGLFAGRIQRKCPPWVGHTIGTGQLAQQIEQISRLVRFDAETVFESTGFIHGIEQIG